MRSLWSKLVSEEDGVLSFEWVVVVSLIAIGIIGGLAAGRDAIIDELGDAAEAMTGVDQSYTIDTPLVIAIDGVVNNASDSEFIDSRAFTDCDRTTAPTGQTP